MDKYLNRKMAGEVLAQELVKYANHKNAIVLALPRGGVPVAYEIADYLNLPLDVFIVRKLGVPHHTELAMGAIATGDACVLNDDIIQDLDISAESIAEVREEETRELQRREMVYRGARPFPDLKDKIIILVDDGIATGASIRVAIQALRSFHPAQIIAAVPVAEKNMCDSIEPLVDKFICPMRPTLFHAVGVWYEDFSQTEDQEVFTLLQKTRKTP
jgi:putative phosphoribosyl transferase